MRVYPCQVFAIDVTSGLLHNTILYCTVLYCTVLYCTVLYTVLYCTVLYTVLYCTLYCTVLYCTVLYCTTPQLDYTKDGPGSTISNVREPKSCLCWVFNSKLGRIAILQNKWMARHAATTWVKNSAQGSSCQLKFVHGWTQYLIAWVFLMFMTLNRRCPE
jgi:hypothetical protein